MKLKVDYNNMMQSSIGERGIGEEAFRKNAALIEKARKNVLDNRGKGWQQWCDSPYISESDLGKIIAYGDRVRKAAESYVVLGIGGSALGAIAVASSLLHLHHNELPREKRNAPKLYVEDNVDPERMNALLDVVDVKTTYFNVITKSGETSETLSQFLIVYDLLKKALGKEEAKKHIAVTTTIGKGTLYALAVKEGFEVFGVEAGVGGRFSVFSPVGLAPFAALGLDVRGFLKGAREASKAAEEKSLNKNPSLITAFLQYEAMKNGCNINVMMPYCDGLKFTADFFCQLWAESLGKATDLNGKTVYAGQTPTKALGVTDQHSQVQLYTEGPFDKVVTFIAVDKFRGDRTITDDREIDACDFLKGHTLGELINAERVATTYALTKANRANFTITLPEVNAETIGELLMYFMYQTAFAGAMLNIDTFNQPGVEEGKKATFAMLGRKGYESKLEEVENAPHDDKYVAG